MDPVDELFIGLGGLALGALGAAIASARRLP